MFNAPPTLAGEGCSVAVAIATRGLEQLKMDLRRGDIRFVGVLNRVVGTGQEMVVPVGDRGGLPVPRVFAGAGAGAVGVRGEAGTGTGGSADSDACARVTTWVGVGVGYTRKYRDFRLVPLRPWYI